MSSPHQAGALRVSQSPVGQDRSVISSVYMIPDALLTFVWNGLVDQAERSQLAPETGAKCPLLGRQRRGYSSSPVGLGGRRNVRRKRSYAFGVRFRRSERPGIGWLAAVPRLAGYPRRHAGSTGSSELHHPHKNTFLHPAITLEFR